MPSYISNFSVSGWQQNQIFAARILPHTEDVKSVVLIHVAGVFPTKYDWGRMANLRTWKYSIREVPGAATIDVGVIVQILGGPGFGTLTIGAYNEWQAMLTDMQLEKVNNDGMIFGRLTFMMEPSWPILGG